MTTFSQNSKNKKAPEGAYLYVYGVPEGIRTPALSVRSRTLYPAELLAHFEVLSQATYLIYYNRKVKECKSFFEKNETFFNLFL